MKRLFVLNISKTNILQEIPLFQHFVTWAQNAFANEAVPLLVYKLIATFLSAVHICEVELEFSSFLPGCPIKSTMYTLFSLQNFT